ncbi:MAG: hypothetical protein ACLU3I_00105 [Acutalibacteraceae bacterium]
MKKKIQLSAPPTGASLEDMLAALAGAKKQLSTLQAQKTSLDTALAAKTADCRILAATIDTCIGRLPPNDALSRFPHVFLDEAGYCSLVKAATLTAYHCPLTFLGDHMQLPPVCEMNDQSIAANPAVSVWAQSALFVRCASERDIASEYLNHRPASFRQMKNTIWCIPIVSGNRLRLCLQKCVLRAIPWKSRKRHRDFLHSRIKAIR